MELLHIFSFVSWILFTSGLYNPITKITRPHVETYWESWDQTHGNYGSNLSDLPVVPIGSSGGFNVVNLAFARDTATIEEVLACDISPDCVTPGLSDMKDNEAFRKAIKVIHDAGGFVKISFGGVTYGTPGESLDEVELELLVHRIVNLLDDFDLDGVDLVLDGCGVSSGKCEHPENVVFIINSLRRMMPNKMISLSFPHQPERYQYYMNVITSTIENLDYLSMIWGFESDVTYLIENGIPKSKIVYGSIVSREKYCDLEFENLIHKAERVKTDQLGGVVYWSINSDTHYRNGHPDDVPGECTDYQTGMEDGTVIKTISYILNND